MTPGVAAGLARLAQAIGTGKKAGVVPSVGALPAGPARRPTRFFNRTVSGQGGGAPFRLIRTRSLTEKTIRRTARVILDPTRDVIVRFDAEGIRGQAYYDQELGMTFEEFQANQHDMTGFAQSQWNPPTTDPVARGSIRITKVYQD